MRLISWLSDALGLRKTEARKVAKDIDERMGPGARVGRLRIDDQGTTVQVKRDRSGRLSVAEGECRRLNESGRLPAIVSD